ncbi:MAG: type II secretion system F family protein [Candidatus Diapherotrites archaeon]|nr:type II secretion system F family protein [Candidatus Diapherotrites archaeon]MDZ4256585.1 type II secretion system F family protein [archaeon]
MPADISGIRERIEEQKKKKRKGFLESANEDVIQEKQIEKIVERMKDRYKKEGLEFNEVHGRLGELKGIISDERKKVDVQGIEALRDMKSPFARLLGGMHLSFQGVFERLGKVIEKFPQMKTLNYYLYSANLPYSARQWVAMITVASVLVFIVSFVFGELLFFLLRFLGEQQGLQLSPLILGLSILLPLLGAIFLSLLTIIVGFLIPSEIARQRGEQCSTELPFALRHMATELRAGIGLYKTIQTIAKADYGVLSEEFSRTIAEIEEGTDTRDALRHFAARTQSRPLANALRHVIRALRTGGNLSEIMGTIATDVSFELQMKVRDYAERLNFFGVIFIFMGIVAPVFVGVMAAIANSGLPLGFAIPLTPIVVLMYFFLLMPAILGMIAYYLYVSQPRV